MNRGKFANYARFSALSGLATSALATFVDVGGFPLNPYIFGEDAIFIFRAIAKVGAVAGNTEVNLVNDTDTITVGPLISNSLTPEILESATLARSDIANTTVGVKLFRVELRLDNVLGLLATATSIDLEVRWNDFPTTVLV